MEDDLPDSPLIKRLKEAGLFGCFNDTGVTSENYKEHLMKSKNDFTIAIDTTGPSIEKSEISINDIEYEVSQDSAAICHCLMLIEETIARLVK